MSSPPSPVFRHRSVELLGIKPKPGADLDAWDLVLPAHPVDGVRTHTQVRGHVPHSRQIPTPFRAGALSRRYDIVHHAHVSPTGHEWRPCGIAIPARIAWKISARVRSSGSDTRSIATTVAIQPLPSATPTITYSAAAPLPRT